MKQVEETYQQNYDEEAEFLKNPELKDAKRINLEDFDLQDFLSVTSSFRVVLKTNIFRSDEFIANTLELFRIPLFGHNKNGLPYSE